MNGQSKRQGGRRSNCARRFKSAMLGKRRPFSQWSHVEKETPSSAAAHLIGMSRCSRQVRKRLASNTPAEDEISETVECAGSGMMIPENKKGANSCPCLTLGTTKHPSRNTRQKPRPLWARPCQCHFRIKNLVVSK